MAGYRKDYKVLYLEKEDGIATITLNRPRRLNAITDQFYVDWIKAIGEVTKDDSLRVLVLTGAGRAFCSGGDFKTTGGELYKLRHLPPKDFQRAYHKFMPQVIGGLQNLDIPTIAMVNGPAYGQGFGMALACDMRVGSDQAKCCVAWTRRGVMPACGEQWTLPRIVGLGRAFEIIFTGREVGAEEAERIGILNKLVPAAKLQEETMELARALAKGPAVAYRLGKMALYKATAGMDMMDTLDFTSAAQAVAFTTEDYWESAKAFEEKREPVFRGR